ncbi:hypothetical protein QWY87_16465 [Lutimonas halocynthiae]|uniref:hypothetical protein n=1 Tax=Lutimonas halocynthiae TaxID=1446477 RepID=UPI0025B2DAAA|nr:hypothetical protein [Lutimonas halocynthiae]MDN3644310.1 hypothetical protein [Lutimonas halocynthiae]
MNRKIQFIIAIFMVLPMLSMANPIKKKWDYEKTKTIKKEFDVNADALLTIKNKYGNVDVISWDQNRIEIEVTITVSGNSESKVIERLSKIDVKFENSRSAVSARTSIENNSKSWYSSNNKMNYEINYKVKVPVTNSVDLNNDYGTISLNEIKGKAEINCDYGKVLIGNLYHEDNSINIDYTSDSEIELMNGGSINADYSKFTIVKAKKIELNADYTDSVFENIEELNFVCDYGKIEVGSVNIVDGHGDYLTMRFGTIYKRLNIQADYGGIKVDKLMKGFQSVDIHTDYAGIKIGLENDIAFDFKANLSYAGFDYDGENITYLKKVVKSSSKYYEGFVNKENSGSVIEISSEYGSVKLYKN